MSEITLPAVAERLHRIQCRASHVDQCDWELKPGWCGGSRDYFLRVVLKLQSELEVTLEVLDSRLNDFEKMKSSIEKAQLLV